VDPFEKARTFTRPRQVAALGLYPYFIPISSQAGPEVLIRGETKLMFGSNNYLGLTQHPAVTEAAIKAVEKFGTSCTGSRFLNGTLDLHVELEDRLAEWTDKESSLVFTTGYQANLGAVSALAGRHDLVIIDRSDHASIVDGTRLGWSEVAKYKHNDMEQLEEILAANVGKKGLLIVVDGVFSMEGDLADLPGIVALKKKYGARIVLDDAHGVGVFGEKGRGTADHFGLQHEMDVIIGTFSKSFASTGGFVAADADVVGYIKHHGRSMVFSAAIPPASAAAALAALEIMETEPERRDRLWENVKRWREGLLSLGLDLGASSTQIVPIIIGEDMKVALLWRRLFDAGLFTNPAVPPAVEAGRSLLRTSVIATHSAENIDRALEIVEQVGAKMAILPQRV
jgi:8-amino-7-oxononanoate synthase